MRFPGSSERLIPGVTASAPLRPASAFQRAVGRRDLDHQQRRGLAKRLPKRAIPGRDGAGAITPRIGRSEEPGKRTRDSTPRETGRFYREDVRHTPSTMRAATWLGLTETPPALVHFAAKPER